MTQIEEFLSEAHPIEEWHSFCAEKIVPPAGKKLLEHVHEYGFFEAPASTKYHGASKGGLLKHSLAVVDMTTTLVNTWNTGSGPEYMQDAIMAAFFHDICKTELYSEVKKWRKDEFGKWESYSGYDIKSGIVQIGHGTESLRLIERMYEFQNEGWAQAVAWHMGLPDDWVGKQQWATAVEKYPEVLVLHTADMYASYIKEL